MGYEMMGHTADVRLKVWGSSEKELFKDALLGMMNILKPLGRETSKSKKEKIKIDVDSPDKTALLVDFLNEALYQSNIKKAVFNDVEFLELSDTKLKAELSGLPAEEFDEDIKAVTYHEADIKSRPDGQLETMLVFDI